MEDLTQIRERVDAIDNQIVDLFKQRMDAAAAVAEYKRANNLPVLDRSRERAKLEDVTSKVPAELKSSAYVLFSQLMEASRMQQRTLLGQASPFDAGIEAAAAATPALFPQEAYVACQGVEGAYAQIAASRLFKRPSISYFDNFEGVFRAVEQGFCSYGVLPLENSTAGSVNQVYDLMMRHDFHIVRSIRLKVDHCLLAKRGTKREDIRDIYSHEMAIAQCGAFLETMPDARVHVCENTAEAAKMVAGSDRSDVAAFSSHACAELYGLEQLAKSVQDQGNNYTRFACITKDLQVFPGADRTSLMLITNHEPGALFKVLASFYALDINVVKLESRPIPDRDFEFMFYFDLECPVAAPELSALLAELATSCEELRYLGSYSEVI